MSNIHRPLNSPGHHCPDDFMQHIIHLDVCEETMDESMQIHLCGDGLISKWKYFIESHLPVVFCVYSTSVQRIIVDSVFT